MHKCKIIYRVVLLLELSRIELDKGKGRVNQNKSEWGAIENYYRLM